MQTEGVKRCLPSPSHPLKKTYVMEAENRLTTDFIGALKETLLADILSDHPNGIFRLYISKSVTDLFATVACRFEILAK